MLYTYKTGRIVIPDRLGIAVGLQDRVGLHNPVLQVGLLLLGRSAVLLRLLVGAEDGKVGDDLLGVLCLAGPGLPGDEHGLILGVGGHLLVGAVGDGKEVGRDLVPPLPDVHPHHPVGVDGVALVGVDHHAEQAGVGLYYTKRRIGLICIVLES